MHFKRLFLAILVGSSILFGLLVPLAWAIELPPSNSRAFIQTSGPATELNIGDWYTNRDQGNRAHNFKIYIPCTVNPDQELTLQLFDPEIYLNPGGIDEPIDEIRSDSGPPQNDTTNFVLLNPQNSVVSQKIYTPSVQYNNAWDDFATFRTRDTGCGTYTLLASTFRDANTPDALLDDDNAWRMRMSPDDPDGEPNSGDEISLGVFESSFQHLPTLDNNGDQTVSCQTFYFYVPVTDSIRLNNFDADVPDYTPLATVRYTLPDQTQVDASESGNAVWNQGSDSSRGGDVISNPQPGWWQAEFCVGGGNQYIFEPEGLPFFFSQPTSPAMLVSKDDGRRVVRPGDVLTYTISFTNTGGSPPGPALNIVLTDRLPTNTTYIAGSCRVLSPGGSCSESNGLVTYAIHGAMEPGASGSAEVAVRVNADAANTVYNSVTLNYTDVLSDPFPPETADDTDILIPPTPDLQIFKTDGGITTKPGGVVAYTLAYTNVTVGVTATGVVITETVPAYSSFNAVASSPGWTCPGGGAGGTACTTMLGSLAGGVAGSVTFAVTVDDPLPTNITRLDNAALISDDGSQGPDPTPENNRTTDDTPIIHPGPPVTKSTKPGGDDDDNDNDEEPPPAPPAGPASQPVATPTPGLPVLFLPATGTREISSEKILSYNYDWLLLIGAGGGIALWQLWRRLKGSDKK